MKKKVSVALVASVALALLWAAPALAGFPKDPIKGCAADAVVAGTVCMDKYEASVWRIPEPTTTYAGVVKKIRAGQATLAMLTMIGATRLGETSDNYAPCNDNGQNCSDDIYAVSLPGVKPSANITWFQAQAACENAGKRLSTNAEWQAAAAGTPDSTACNVSTGFATLTGAMTSCVSSDGAFDMVGNLCRPRTRSRNAPPTRWPPDRCAWIPTRPASGWCPTLWRPMRRW